MPCHALAGLPIPTLNEIPIGQESPHLPISAKELKLAYSNHGRNLKREGEGKGGGLVPCLARLGAKDGTHTHVHTHPATGRRKGRAHNPTTCLTAIVGFERMIILARTHSRSAAAAPLPSLAALQPLFLVSSRSGLPAFMLLHVSACAHSPSWVILRRHRGAGRRRERGAKE